MECQKKLMSEGKNYPRTCGKCGFGKPCAEGFDQNQLIEEIKRLKEEMGEMKKNIEMFFDTEENSLQKNKFLDIALTVFVYSRNTRGGELCHDWPNDTLPMITEKLKEVKREILETKKDFLKMIPEEIYNKSLSDIPYKMRASGGDVQSIAVKLRK